MGSRVRGLVISFLKGKFGYQLGNIIRGDVSLADKGTSPVFYC